MDGASPSSSRHLNKYYLKDTGKPEGKSDDST